MIAGVGRGRGRPCDLRLIYGFDRSFELLLLDCENFSTVAARAPPNDGAYRNIFNLNSSAIRWRTCHRLLSDNETHPTRLVSPNPVDSSNFRINRNLIFNFYPKRKIQSAESIPFIDRRENKCHRHSVSHTIFVQLTSRSAFAFPPVPINFIPTPHQSLSGRY
jgi:hypothetical protein